MPQPKGQTGNPNGRPKGVQNKLSIELKELMSTFLNGNINTFIKDFKKIDDPVQRAKLYLEAYKTVVPKPTEEVIVEEENKYRSELMNRLFPNREEN
jgi:hypothetical protein